MKSFGAQVKRFMSSYTKPRQNGSVRANALTPINADGLSVSAYTLGIIYSLIARGNVILAHYACCHGNFSEVALQVIKNIELDTDGKLTYAAGEYVLSLSLSLSLSLFLLLSCSHTLLIMCTRTHTSRYMYHYICEGGIVYLCITDDVSGKQLFSRVNSMCDGTVYSL